MIYINRAKGILALEMLIFLPLAALLSFVAIDFAFYITDHGLITDALRSSLNSYKSYQGPLLSINSDFSYTIPNCSFFEHLENITRSNFEEAIEIKNQNNQNYSLTTTALFTVYDINSGVAYSNTVIDSDTCPNITPINNTYHKQEVINKMLSGAKSQSWNLGKIPIPVKSPADVSIFYPFLISITIEIDTHSRSINPFITKLLMQDLFRIRISDTIIIDPVWALNNSPT